MLSYFIDFAANAATAVVVVAIIYQLNIRAKMKTNLVASLGVSILFGLFYLEAKLFHVSVVVIALRVGGIGWKDSPYLLAVCLVGLLAAVFFYFKDGAFYVSEKS